MAVNTPEATARSDSSGSRLPTLVIAGDPGQAERVRVALESLGLRVLPWGEQRRHLGVAGSETPSIEGTFGASEVWMVGVDEASKALAELRRIGQMKEPPEDSMQSLHRLEWVHIQRALSDCDGNISAAARRLGIHRRSLQRKLSKVPPVR